MSLDSFNATPFTTATAVGQVDLATTDGLTATYFLANKLASDVGSTLQYNIIQKYRFNAGFSIDTDDDSVTLDTIPAANQVLVIPSRSAVVLAAYDKSITFGNLTSANIKEKEVWFGGNDVWLNYYIAPTGSAGIGITLVNNITGLGSGADLSWVQLACANAAGVALTYQATGTTLYTPNLAGFATFAASSNSGTNTPLVTITGYDFIPGDYLYFNPGQGTQEVVQLSSLVIGASYQTLTLSASFNYPHYILEPVYSHKRKFFIRETVPINSTGNTAKNYYNMSYRIDAGMAQRE